MTGWLIAAAILALVLTAKVGVRISWDDGVSRMKLQVGFLRFGLDTRAKKTQKTEFKPEKNEEKPVSAEKKTSQSTALKPWLAAVWQERDAVLALLGRLLHAPMLELLRLQIAVGGQEPELTYGRIWAGLGEGLPAVHGIFKVKKQELDVVCSYDLPETQIVAEIAATVHVYELAALAFGGLWLLLKIYRAKSNG